LTALIDKTIRTAMARTLWVWAWGNFNGEQGPPMQQGDGPGGEVHVPFWRWDDEKEMRLTEYRDWHAYTTPQAAYLAADALITLYRHQDRNEYGDGATPSTLLTVALMADQDSDELENLENATHFGQMLVEMAINGAQRRDFGLRSWFDNHAQFTLAVPSFACTITVAHRLDLFGYPTHDLAWTGDLDDSAANGTSPVSLFGDEPRIEAGGEEPDLLGDGIHDLGGRGDQGTVADVVVDRLIDLADGVLVAGGNLGHFVEPEVAARPGVSAYRPEYNFLVFGVSEIELKKVSEIIADTGEANEGRVSGRRVLRRWGRLVYINDNDRTYKRNTFVLWAGHDSRGIVVYCDGFEDAFEEMMDYLSEYAPGRLANDEVREEYIRLERAFIAEHHGRQPDEDERCSLYEAAEVDTSSDGQGNHIASHEWGIIAENPSPEDLERLAHA
jgi:hypothetical protein